MLENPRVVTVKLKKYQVSYLTSHFGLYLKKKLKFSKNFLYSFIDLGLPFDLSKKESYRTFAAKAGFFTCKKSI